VRGSPVPIDTGRGLFTKCEWCGSPATTTVRDQWRTVMSRKNGGSGSVFTGGPETLFAVCQGCKERLTERYLNARVK